MGGHASKCSPLVFVSNWGKTFLSWFKFYESRLADISYYDKCSQILNTFPFCFEVFSYKMFVACIRAEIHKLLVRIANREDPDQTASEEAV